MIINKKIGPASIIGKSSDIDLEKIKLLSCDYFDIQIAYHEHTLFNSTHSKIVICDVKNTAGITGDPTFANTTQKDNNWVEVATLCNSEILAAAMRCQFIALWNNTMVRIDYPSPEKALLDYPPIDESVHNYNNLTTLFLAKNPSANPLVSYNSPYKMALLALLKTANNSVKILVSNINDTDILEAILECAKKEVTIEMVIGRYQSEARERLPLAGGTNISSMTYLLNNASLQEKEKLDLRWACDENNSLIQNSEPGTVHAKVVIVDEKFVLTGSSPMDQQSWRSGESDILFQSTTLAKQYIDSAFAPIFNKARPIQFTATTLPSTREELQIQLNQARSKEEVSEVIKGYIYMREYEEALSIPRNLVSFFFNQNEHDRQHKITQARKILDSNNLPENLEGFLKEIYDKYITFSTQPEIQSDERHNIL